jgi:hypothetical protein
MNHGTEAGIGDIPLATYCFWKINGVFRAKINTNPATFAGHRINNKIIADGIKTAEIGACSALVAFFMVDDGRVARLKVVALFYIRGHDQVKISSIYVCIAERFIFGHRGKSGHKAGFACTTLAADDDQFFHSNGSFT